MAQRIFIQSIILLIILNLVVSGCDKKSNPPNFPDDSASPVAIANAVPHNVAIGHEVHFFDDGSYDPDGGSIVKHEWDWNNDGIFDETGANTEHLWGTSGTWLVQFRVTDDEAAMDILDEPLEIFIWPNDEDIPDPDPVYGWHVEVVDSEGNTGYSPKLDVDSRDYPHIFYYDYHSPGDNGNNVLKRTWKSESGWNTEKFFPMEWLDGLVIDSSDVMHVLITSADPEPVLVYIRYNGYDLNTEPVFAPRAGTPAGIGLDKNEKPHIAFDGNGGRERHAWQGESGWQWEEVYYGTHYSAIHSSIAFDSENHPHIAHCQNYGNLELYHSYFNGVSWQTEVIDAPGYEPILKIDENDNIHVTYENGSGIDPNTSIKYAVYSGGAWHIITLDDPGSVNMRHPSMVLDNNGNPHISYVSVVPGADGSADDLRYAFNDGTLWKFESPDPAGADLMIGRDPSIALLDGDMPCIAYYDETNGDLKYAWYGEMEP